MSPYLQLLQNHSKSKSRGLVILALVLLVVLDDQIIGTVCEKDPKPVSSSNSYNYQNYLGGGERCGSFQIPFPFCLLNTSSCSCKWSGLLSAGAFSLSCLNSTSLFLNIASQSYRVLYFFKDGVLVDFPNNNNRSTFCHRYNHLNYFTFAGDQYFGISTDNVLALYGCHDSLSCKTTDCSSMPAAVCDDDDDAAAGGYHPSCCCPLYDIIRPWHYPTINAFSFFSQFGCSGFSSWVVLPPGNGGIRGSSMLQGVKLEWAVPRNSAVATCAANAEAINASSVASGMRCQCRDGFLGDGFASGVGCFQSGQDDGKEAPVSDCYRKSNHMGKAKVVAGVLAAILAVTSLVAVLVCLLKKPSQSSRRHEPDDECSGHSESISFRKTHRTRMFAFHELEEATIGFDDGQKLSIDGGINSGLYAGNFSDGSRVAVHVIRCESETEQTQILSRVEVLSSVMHKNIAPLIGWSTDSSRNTLLLVYEYPSNGTLEEQLFKTGGGDEEKITGGLDWFKRLSIVAETASFLAFLQREISPPVFHCDLRSSHIFLDDEFSVKIAGFGVPRIYSDMTKVQDVYKLGLILLEVITGTISSDVPATTLKKIRYGKLQEVVDPFLYYHEQPPYRREQIEIVADLATRCLLFGHVDGKLGMTDVARELVHITKQSLSGNSMRCPALEETFSNSSLLQMISMSPDSLYVP